MLQQQLLPLLLLVRQLWQVWQSVWCQGLRIRLRLRRLLLA
jgi:hypothetical protein